MMYGENTTPISSLLYTPYTAATAATYTIHGGDSRHKPYMEAGVGIDNILTVLRIDYVWRLNYRDVAARDRHGIRLGLHFNF